MEPFKLFFEFFTHKNFTTEHKIKDRVVYFNLLKDMGVIGSLNSKKEINVLSLPDEYPFERYLLEQIPSPILNVYGVDYHPKKALYNALMFKVNKPNVNVFVPYTRRKLVYFENILTDDSKFMNAKTTEVVNQPKYDVIDFDATGTPLPKYLDAIEHAFNNKLNAGGFVHLTFTNLSHGKSYISARTSKSNYDEDINVTEPDTADSYGIPDSVYLDESNSTKICNTIDSIKQVKNANFTTLDLAERGMTPVYVNLYRSKGGITYMYSAIILKK